MIDAGNEVQVKQTGLRPVCRPHAFPATRVEAVVQNEHDLLLWLQFEQRLNVAPYSLASMISIKQNKTDRPSLLVQFRYHIRNIRAESPERSSTFGNLPANRIATCGSISTEITASEKRDRTRNDPPR
jgi:hypothetical protein